MKRVLYLIIIYIIQIFFSCSQSGKKTKKGSLHYARNFYVEKREGYKLLHLIRPYPGASEQQWILIERGKKVNIPDSLQSLPRLNVPLRSIVPMSTTHLIYLLALGEADKVTGFPHVDYIRMPYFRRLKREGKLVDVGNEMRPDLERIIQLHPEAVFVFSTGDDGKDFNLLEQAGISVIYVSEWLEAHPLGRAEWIKFFGYLTGKEKKGDSIFVSIEKAYLTIKHKSDTIVSDRKPKVLQAAEFRGVWFVPGGKTWASVMIRDAGGIPLPEKDTSTHTLRMGPERVFQLLAKADLWINSGYAKPEDSVFIKKTKMIMLKDLLPGSDTVSFFEWSPLYPDQILIKLNEILYGK